MGIYTYAFFLAVILVAQIGAGIAAYMLKGDLDAEVVKNMNKGMENYEKPDFDGVTTTWDIVQNELHCCVGGQKKGCGKTDAEKFEVGCYSLFKTKFIDNIAIIGAVALGVAGIELAIVLFACCLGKRMGYTSQYV